MILDYFHSFYENSIHNLHFLSFFKLGRGTQATPPKWKKIIFFSTKMCRFWPFYPSEGNFDTLAGLYAYFYVINMISEIFQKWAWPNNCLLIMQYSENWPSLNAKMARLQHVHTEILSQHFLLDFSVARNAFKPGCISLHNDIMTFHYA